MLLKRFYDEKLAQASYLVGCSATGEAIVIDPNRDADQYVRAAAAEGMRVTHVTETHIHADFVSGSRELARRTGARLLLSDEGGGDWKYSFAASDDATLLRDGDEFRVGKVKFEVLHTPGHTPEHLTFLVTDTAATGQRLAAITGDFVFAGDVGRPDLLEKAAKIKGTMDASARSLFKSLQRFKTLPDYLQIWPGHGAGSACGKALGAMPFSTVGYEKIANWAFAIEDENEFVEMVLTGQPEPPKYFAEMKRINKEGPAILGDVPAPELLAPSEAGRLLAEGALIVDTRAAEAYAKGHVAGTVNIPYDKSFTTWAGWLVPYTRPFYIIVGGKGAASMEAPVRDLAMIGLDHVAGVFDSEVFAAWRAAGNELSTVTRINATELFRRLASESVSVIDVRAQAEWEEARIPGVENIPLGMLEDRIAEVPRDKTVVVHCKGGTRSAIATSILESAGVTDVVNLAGGFSEWAAAAYPIERGAPSKSTLRGTRDNSDFSNSPLAR